MYKRKRKLLFFYIFLLVFIAGCNSGTVSTVEVTRIVKETIEVTRISSISFTPTPIVIKTVSPSLTPPINKIETPEVKRVSLDYDAVMVITEFYLFSGHGLYAEAYNLLSASKQRTMSLDDYIRNEKGIGIYSISLFTIQPLYEWASQEGITVNKDPDGIRRFIVWLTAFGEGGMAGSVPNGTIQQPIITLTTEKGEWKICSIGNIPTVNPVDCK